MRAITLLDLPSQHWEAVLHLAHSIPQAGQLGRNKTASRTLQRFYWPTVFKDMVHYCKCCAECQKTSPQRAPRAPLIPLSIINEPFGRIAMDIVGPLPRSHLGKKYNLVICDYTTRYPKDIALKSIEAECIAEELMKLFARVGVPKEILTDQGSKFTSHLLAKLYRLLHITPIRTSPYHPQTDGLIKRFNQTLKVSRLPTSTNKLLAEWQGLYPIVCRVGRVVYKIDMENRRRRKRRFHVNMLQMDRTCLLLLLDGRRQPRQ